VWPFQLRSRGSRRIAASENDIKYFNERARARALPARRLHIGRDDRAPAPRLLGESDVIRREILENKADKRRIFRYSLASWSALFNLA